MVCDFEFRVQGLRVGRPSRVCVLRGVTVVVPLVYHKRDQMRNRFCIGKSRFGSKEFTHRDGNRQVAFPGRWARLSVH